MTLFSSIFQRSVRRRTYATLMHLDDHLLRDIGLSRGDVQQLINGRGVPSRAISHE